MTAPSIHVLMGRVLAELPAIGKDDYNPQQKFHFRGIDAVLNALNPLLAKHGVFYAPEVVERLEGVRQTKGGSAMFVVHLHVRYRFYGPAGDYVEASAWGEGTDMGDKATNKAMTGAMKYVLFQVFAISTQEASETDADRYAPDESVVLDTPCPEQGCRFRGENKQHVAAHLVESHGWVSEGGKVRPPQIAPLGDSGEGATAVPPDASSPLLSPPRRTRLLLVCKERGLVDREDRLGWASVELGRTVETFSDLGAAEGERLIAAAEALPVPATLEGVG